METLLQNFESKSVGQNPKRGITMVKGSVQFVFCFSRYGVTSQQKSPSNLNSTNNMSCFAFSANTDKIKFNILLLSKAEFFSVGNACLLSLPTFGRVELHFFLLIFKNSLHIQKISPLSLRGTNISSQFVDVSKLGLFLFVLKICLLVMFILLFLYA